MGGFQGQKRNCRIGQVEVEAGHRPGKGCFACSDCGVLSLLPCPFFLAMAARLTDTPIFRDTFASTRMKRPLQSKYNVGQKRELADGKARQRGCISAFSFVIQPVMYDPYSHVEMLRSCIKVSEREKAGSISQF